MQKLLQLTDGTENFEWLGMKFFCEVSNKIHSFASLFIDWSVGYV